MFAQLKQGFANTFKTAKDTAQEYGCPAKKPQIHSINMDNPHCITILSCISKYGDVNCDKQYCLIRIIYANLLT